MFPFRVCDQLKRGGEKQGEHCNYSTLHLWQHTKGEIVKDRCLLKKSVNTGRLISSSAFSSLRETIKDDIT